MGNFFASKKLLAKTAHCGAACLIEAQAFSTGSYTKLKNFTKTCFTQPCSARQTFIGASGWLEVAELVFRMNTRCVVAGPYQIRVTGIGAYSHERRATSYHQWPSQKVCRNGCPRALLQLHLYVA